MVITERLKLTLRASSASEADEWRAAIAGVIANKRTSPGITDPANVPLEEAREIDDDDLDETETPRGSTRQSEVLHTTVAVSVKPDADAAPGHLPPPAQLDEASVDSTGPFDTTPEADVLPARPSIWMGLCQRVEMCLGASAGRP